MATCDFAAHHERVLSLAIASSVGESVVQLACAVKSGLAVLGGVGPWTYACVKGGGVIELEAVCSSSSVGSVL